ncbi:hypothetical protein P2H44_01115 [Albimonas sp. CAU 1670]|uniref:hypothetical protein n=1 Tax=Albimonas sp. CAU 1670 TaxID=3032599 RepID=UPI0023DA0D4C|nr:hypothetical protein [Albimonas sp. CAU 1670]MDF2231145.1 hypothetical protein [Albimonas sp. CAU 1670]
MTRLELALALGAAMALSAALGWALHALWARLVRRPDAAEARQQELMRQLADAEEARDALVAEAAAERDALHGRLEEVETELTRALHEREAELEAAMDTIGSLRREIEALRGAG